MNEVKKIEDYFQRTAEDFDSIYSGQKNWLLRFLDAIFRKSMHRRFQQTFQECGDVGNKSVLDIGCGSGRYSVEFARRGARVVVGIDFAERMLDLARGLAERQGVGQVCKFIKADFFTYNFQDKFDICVAIGVLEYLSDPQAFLQRLKTVAGSMIIISVPVKWTLRSLLRKIRLTIKGCPVYFYTKTKIKRLLQECQFKAYNVVRLDRDYLVVIRI